MVNGKVLIRRAALADVPELVRLRRVMFESMGYDRAEQLDPADAAATVYFEQAIAVGQFYGWLAITTAGEAVASGGLVIDQHPPGPGNLSGQVGYIMNLVTLPTYRRQGIARRMMQTMLGFLREHGIARVSLHATEVGRALYREMGFVDSNEMVAWLEQT